MKRETVSTIFTGVLVVCALVVTGLVIKREFFKDKGKKKKVQKIANWQVLKNGGHYYWGNKNSSVQIFEFFDFECPYCGDFEKTLDRIKENYGNKIALVKYNFPLEMHQFAYPAAIAAECAGSQNRYNKYHDLLFENQHNLQNIDWDSLAVEADIKKY